MSVDVVIPNYKNTDSHSITIATDHNGVLIPEDGMKQYKSFVNLNELGYTGAYRPKSSPASKFHGKKGKISRPKTAAAVLLRNECDRVNQLQHEPTRRHNFENHIPPRKQRTPAWQSKLDPPLETCVVGPGYILSRSRSKFSMVLKDDFFQSDVPDSPKSPVVRKQVSVIKGDPERDSLITILQQQVNDLTLYLEEERLNHRQTKQKSEEYLKDRLDDLTHQYKNHTKTLKAEHKCNMINLEKDKEKEFDDYKQLTNQQMHKMVTEIEFLQGAFESYKGTLEKETDGKWSNKEVELREKLEQEKTDAILEFKSKILQEKVVDKTNVSKEFQKQKEIIRKEHKKEIEALIRRYATAAADLDKLKKVVTELGEVKNELEEVRISYSQTCSQLNTNSRLLTDTKIRLLEYEEQFDDKVKLIDDKYCNKIDNMMRQNTELRQLYVKKCGQLFEEKARVEKQVYDKVTTAKQAMKALILVKERSNVNLIASDPDLEKRARKPKTRPESAPTTHLEGVTAHLSAGETDHLTRPEEFIRPDTILPEDSPEIVKLRSELFSEDVKVYSKEDLLHVLQS